MKKLAIETITTAENAVVTKSAIATKGSRNLLLLHLSLLPSPPLSAMLLSAPKKSLSHSLLVSKAR
jgi:hypothetical protein